MEAGTNPAGQPAEAVTTEMPRIEGAAGTSAPSDAAGGESPAAAHAAAEHDAFAERPELYVGGAFVGGLVLAQLLKRLGR